uniref:Uncharacterized protein n=1 Tax=Callorhinchus milii TaxID=7868 RepID=A0A4W3JP24_CALMI
SSIVSLDNSSGSCEWLDLDDKFNFSAPYVVSPLLQASLEYDKERDEENHLYEIRRQLIELQEQYQSKQLEHEEYKQKLKELEVFYKEQIQQQQRYVEEFRLHIQVAQSQAQQELEHDQEQLNQQIKENQLCLANEERRLVSLEQQRRDLGVQTESPSFSECGVQITVETDEIPSIEQNRKRLVQLELLQKHSLRKAERSISKKKVKFQLERIAEKHKLLEAKQNLRELETASLLSEHQTKLDKSRTVQTTSNSRVTCWRKSRSPGFFRPRSHSLSVPLVRRHSDTNNLVSRLYPQHAPVYSDFLKRKTSDLATSSQTKKPSTPQETF